MVEDSFSTPITPDEDADAGSAPKATPMGMKPSAARRAIGAYSSGGAAGAMMVWSDPDGEGDPAA
jgi:hypothetical protein